MLNQVLVLIFLIAIILAVFAITLWYQERLMIRILRYLVEQNEPQTHVQICAGIGMKYDKLRYLERFMRQAGYIDVVPDFSMPRGYWVITQAGRKRSGIIPTFNPKRPGGQSNVNR